MSPSPLPELVVRALDLATAEGFSRSCRPEQGRLLHALAAGALGRIGETGTGCGVGLAWMLAGRRPGVHVVSVEVEPRLASLTHKLFADVPDLDILCGDWADIHPHGPFDLLVLDGGGNGKKGPAADVGRLLRPGGTVVVDDMTPMTTWPPTHDGDLDKARMAWLEHPLLLTTEVRLAPDLSTILGTRRP